jgi:hypothetical protein
MTRAETGVLAALGYVAFAATLSLVLAAAGLHEAAPVLCGVALLVAAAKTARRLRAADPDGAGALLVLGAVAIGTLLYVPAFPYGSSDRDPGVYAYSTYAIARTGSLYVPDPLAGSGLATLVDGQRAPGVHPAGDTALPGFFLAEPALAATVYRVFGDGGRRLLNPVVAMLAVAAFALTVLRLAGRFAGTLTLLLVAGTMVQVWQAKTPGPEMLAQAGVAGALLAAATRQWKAAGALTAFVWVARPDGLLAVLLGWTAGRRRYRRGLLLALPVPLWQTYAVAGDYAARNGVPPWPLLLVILVLAVLARPVARRAWRLAPYAAAVLVAVLLVRQWLAPAPPPLVPWRAVEGYEPYTLSRIAGLVTWPAIVLALAGVRAATRRRWALLLGPAVLGAPYLVDPRISPDLMFWGRRFVPMLLPAIAMLAAAGAAALVRRRVVGVLAAAATVVAVVVPYTQSWALRGHREYGGGLAAARAAADASGGEQAVYLWVRTLEDCCDQPAYHWAGAVWLRYGKASLSVLPEEAPEQAAKAAALPQGWPVLVVAEGREPPFAGDLTAVAYHEATMPVWERGGLDRPTKARQVRIDFTVWRYAATPG